MQDRPRVVQSIDNEFTPFSKKKWMSIIPELWIKMNFMKS
jgi:hypothetical protein